MVRYNIDYLSMDANTRHQPTVLTKPKANMKPLHLIFDKADGERFNFIFDEDLVTGFTVGPCEATKVE